MTARWLSIVADLVADVKTGAAAFSNRVYEWRPASPGPTALPYAIVGIENETPLEQAGYTRERLQVAVVIVEAFDQKTAVISGLATLAPLVVDVVKSVLGDPDRSSGETNYALDTVAAGWRPLPTDEERPNEITAQVDFVVHYRHDFADPETLS